MPKYFPLCFNAHMGEILGREEEEERERERTIKRRRRRRDTDLGPRRRRRRRRLLQEWAAEAGGWVVASGQKPRGRGQRIADSTKKYCKN